MAKLVQKDGIISSSQIPIGQFMKRLLISAFVMTFAFASSLAISAWDKDESVELDAKAQEAMAEVDSRT